LGILSALYRLGLSCHKSLVKPKILPGKVVSVGNLTLGGTGKTPAVISLARETKKRGFSPCVPVISASEAGDEALLMAELLKDIPVIKGSNRYESGMLAFREYFKNLPPVFILDDGFQHWALKRDMNIVLIDATNPFGNGKLLPEGPLREPLEGLNRADIIILTKSDMTSKEALADTMQKVKKYNSRAPVFSATHKPVDLISVNGDIRTLDFLSKKKVYTFAAIANTFSFESLLRAHGAEIVQCKNYRDHYSYKQKDLDDIKNDALGLDIITTEKDLVKIRDLQMPGNVYALRIEFSVANDFYTDFFRRL
jgi:tetraacyldisaccharide 4'-kinase